MEIIDASVNQNFHFEKPESVSSTKLKNLAEKSALSLGRITAERDVAVVSFRQDFLLNSNVESEDDRLVLAIEKRRKNDVDEFYVKTGLYAGRISYGDVLFNIKPDCSNALYEQMLNYANHIYIDKTEDNGERKDHSDFPLIEYLFLSSLQRASVMGLPQEYSKQRYHDIKVHGGLDIQNYIKKDFPFMGRISSQKNERHYVQCVVDVLFTALKACRGEIEKNFKRLNLIKNELNASYSGKFPSQQTILKAQTHRVLNNPMFADFKQTLKFAEIVIRHNAILPDAKDSAIASGYLLDVASLWEVYLEHLLQTRLDGWSVSAQEKINLYQDCFFKRENRPDFVLRKDDGSCIAVLDAKFKRMDGVYKKYSDVDREDLFQIHSYAGYYRERGVKDIRCGLIYPLSQKVLEKNQASLYGLTEEYRVHDGSKAKFMVDGIYKGVDDCSVLDSKYSVADAEDAFIERLKFFLNS
ncbi:hypothetical protein [Fibrobacter sp. UWB7]|uniref:5-methylcytosine restriction system specificity protein McrC n=1 Tax=Fibrobacter sp. UWB7 TaxID=1896206 RepID=UPI00091A3889|nr:hypothetical protein [Fibrobacter sp. UWB7]SHM74068.1 McrBC 5-methylcytosine restriction system component [Fibrobacter sp. UWB7]